jgi:Zn-dependent M28 family amino/carboxypeptidase
MAAEPAFLGPPEAPPADGPLLLRIPAAKGEELLPALARATGATATFTTGGTLLPMTSRNVLAVLPGSDPDLAREAVVLGAHYDHLGQRGGQTLPGADDNASGVAGLLEIARAFAAAPQRPKRTLVFAFWTGEEEGRFGSSHFVRHPRWPLARTVAYLNLDMIGHPWTREEIRKLVEEARFDGAGEFLARVRTEDFIEPGVASGAPWLGPLLATAGSGLGLPLHLDWTDGLHGGSDYKPFARAGVPFVRFFGNFFPDYHKPGDTAARLDPAQVLKVTRLAYATAWLLVDR